MMRTMQGLKAADPWSRSIRRLFRVVTVGGLLALVVLVFEGPVGRILDRFDAAREPWVSAQIEISPFSDAESRTPMIWYRPAARREASGQWNARIEIDVDPGPKRQPATLGRAAKGAGSYSPDTGRHLRSWSWFFEDDRPAPNRDYRICVFYDLRSDSGVQQITPDGCSEWVTP